MVLFTTHITPRLQYIAQTLLGNDVQLVTNEEIFKLSASPKINYSPAKIADDELWIQPHGLLHQTNIQEQTTNCFTWQGYPVFFKTNGHIPFDIFSAAFYLITRYEEYLPHTFDSYGRYAHTNSVAFQNSFLHQPLINFWLQQLIKLLNPSTTNHQLPTTNFSFLPTYDIDIAYAYHHQPLLKNIAGFFKDFVQGNFEKVIERGNVYSGWQQDPFDVYAWLDGLHQQYNLSPTYFFLLAAKQKGYDKNISPQSTAIQQLIKHHAGKYSVGIHPSWQSNDDKKLLATEIQVLSSITQKNTTQARQHYIKMKLPQTYRNLIAQGITNDYTMGYGSINGFRASYTLPFTWFDVELNQPTSLTIHPFCYMEANSFFEQKLTAAEAAKELQQYHDIVKQVNGTLIIIFHNHFITQQPQWLAWRSMYENFLKQNFSK
jgi:hypothetical protein